MATYTEKETKLMAKIAETINRMEEAAQVSNWSDDSDEAYAARRDALHEMRKLARQERRMDRLIDDENAVNEAIIEDDEAAKADAADEIGYTLDKLDRTLDKLDATDSRVKGWYEQKKAIHEIKRILNQADLYDAYDEDELAHL